MASEPMERDSASVVRGSASEHQGETAVHVPGAAPMDKTVSHGGEDTERPQLSYPLSVGTLAG